MSGKSGFADRMNEAVGGVISTGATEVPPLAPVPFVNQPLPGATPDAANESDPTKLIDFMIEHFQNQ